MHLTRDELIRWRDRSDEADRPRLMNHLASCADCRRQLAALTRENPAGAEPAFDPGVFVAAGRAVYRPARSWWQQPRVWIAASGLAAAALVLAVVIPRALDRPLDDGGIRSAELRPLAPVGEAPAPAEFRWTSPFAAPRYRLEVRDSANQIVLGGETAAETYTIPDLFRSRLVPGTYTWTVDALDESGEIIASSNPQRFTIVQ
ncbi:MAG: hypothetical protein FJW14_04720 [Acidimicrobiia bacterium]|nr:hypothetical protein [Acidimicrobiia bacterium]